MTPRAGWTGLVQRALLGTERASSTTTDVAPDIAELLGRVDASDGERALLASAAIASAYESAGQLPRRATTEAIVPAPLDADDAPEVPPGVARFLTTMLTGVNDEVLREWFDVVARRGWRVASHQLPALLDVGKNASFLRPMITSVLGARGRWLAARNPDWSWAAAPVQLDEASVRASWEIGTPDERGAILSATRLRDAGLGRALIESTWETDLPSHRATFIGLLILNLSLDDEPLLERALDDRRQEVRRVAADLLRRLGGSQLVARMTGRARSALQWKAGGLLKSAEIVVEPPTEIDEATIRDGVEKKPPAAMGERAWWMTQIVAAIPPHTWTTEWKASPDDIVAAANRGEWSQALTQGLAIATVNHRDGAMAEALLASGFPSEKATGFAPAIPALMGVMPLERREGFTAHEIKKHPSAAATVAYVAAADHPWTASFTHVALDWLRVRLTVPEEKASPTDWQLREAVPRLALRVPATTKGALDGWPVGEAAGGYAKAVDQFISILSFRRELAEELDR